MKCVLRHGGCTSWHWHPWLVSVDAEETLETFSKAWLFLGTLTVPWLSLVVHRVRTFERKVSRLEFITSFWDKLRTWCRSWSCEVALTHATEGLWSRVLHRAEIMPRPSTKEEFAVCCLVCGSHRKG